MIVEFSVGNFRSIKEVQTISFVATGLKSSEDNSEVDLNNIEEEGGIRLLKTVGIYGANGSGKSNIIKAFEYFLQTIKQEPSSESNLNSVCDPFLYENNAIETESFFQIVLFVEGKKYRYGYTVKKNLNLKLGEKDSKEIITNEWLSGTKKNNIGEFFIREGLNISKDKLPNDDKIPPIPYEHTLFLTHASAFDKEGICALVRNTIAHWTISNFKGFEQFRWNSIVLLDDVKKKTEFLDLLSSFNLKYEDVIIEREPNKPLQDIPTQDKIFFFRSYKNQNNETINIKLNLGNNESAGTQKLFDIAGLLLRAFSMPKSVFVIIDEVDSNFHPSLLIKLIGLFNNPKINKSKSQLLFTSHDTNLMSPSLMRRDQFYFTEKRDNNSTRLYSLADLKGIRNDANFSKDYLVGLYGALPILENYSNQNSIQDEGTVEH